MLAGVSVDAHFQARSVVLFMGWASSSASQYGTTERRDIPNGRGVHTGVDSLDRSDPLFDGPSRLPSAVDHLGKLQ
jgi:hypothetical protein